MAASDIDLLALLIAQPTLTLEEAVRVLAAREDQPCPSEHRTVAAIVRSPNVFAGTLRSDEPVPDLWRN